MITFKLSCPDHGDIEVGVDDLLLANTVYMVHCPQVDHLFLQGLTPKVEAVLAGCHVERLCP